MQALDERGGHRGADAVAEPSFQISKRGCLPRSAISDSALISPIEERGRWLATNDGRTTSRWAGHGSYSSPLAAPTVLQGASPFVSAFSSRAKKAGRLAIVPSGQDSAARLCKATPRASTAAAEQDQIPSLSSTTTKKGLRFPRWCSAAAPIRRGRSRWRRTLIRVQVLLRLTGYELHRSAFSHSHLPPGG